jgi:hypothetical protein
VLTLLLESLLPQALSGEGAAARRIAGLLQIAARQILPWQRQLVDLPVPAQK